MQEVAAYSTLAMTLSLVVTRPRLGTFFRITPAGAAIVGVLIMAGFGVIGPGSVRSVALDVWRPFLAIASIMAMTAVALEMGVLSWMASRIESRARTTVQLYRMVFVISTVTAATLNNDAAILLLTPLVVAMVRRLYPDRPELIVPFAFAVFMAAGVAPFVVSNPMNMVVANVSGIGFNAYAVRMVPIAVAGWVIAYFVLRLLFRKHLTGELPRRARELSPMTPAQRSVVLLLLAVLAAYPIVGYVGGPVWLVACCGAVAALTVARYHSGTDPAEILRVGVCWETLAFLAAVMLLSIGLLNVGFVEHLTGHYDTTGSVGIGVTSAVGSAFLNNHPMAYMNMMALETGSYGSDGVLAALIGGDLGPRLLPMGSLAGLLWLEMLRRQGVEIRLRQFVRVGVLVTVPALAVSLLLLSWM